MTAFPAAKLSVTVPCCITPPVHFLLLPVPSCLWHTAGPSVWLCAAAFHRPAVQRHFLVLPHQPHHHSGCRWVSLPCVCSCKAWMVFDRDALSFKGVVHYSTVERGADYVPVAAASCFASCCCPLRAGHYLPETNPRRAAAEIVRFLRST